MRAVLGGDGIPGQQIQIDQRAAERADVDRAALQDAMTRHAGVLRSAASLERADAAAAHVRQEDGVAGAETRNLAVIARALVAAALAREETRGAHTRTDHPEPSDKLVLRFVVGG